MISRAQMRRCAPCFLSLVVFFSIPRVRAQAPSSDALVEQGVALRRTGDDAGALRLFQQAYELDHSPHALAQVALDEQALGHWIDAEGHLAAALAETNDWIASHRDTLVHQLDVIHEHLGRVELVGGPPGAHVKLAGRDAGVLPLAGAAWVVPGDVIVEVSADGFYPLTHTVNVAAGALARDSIDMVVRAVEPTITTPVETHVMTATHETHPTNATDAHATPTRPRPPPDPDSGWRTLGWYGYAIGLGAMTIGLASNIAREISVENFNYRCPDPRPGGYSQYCLDQWYSGHSAEAAAYGFEIGGLILGGAGTSLALGLTRGRDGGWRGLGWVGFSLGLVMLTQAGVLTFVHATLKSDPSSIDPGMAASQRALDADFVGPAMWASWIIGGLLTVGGLLLGVLVGAHHEDTGAGSSSSATVSCAPVLGSSFGLGCQGSF